MSISSHTTIIYSKYYILLNGTAVMLTASKEDKGWTLKSHRFASVLPVLALANILR